MPITGDACSKHNVLSQCLLMVTIPRSCLSRKFMWIKDKNGLVTNIRSPSSSDDFMTRCITPLLKTIDLLQNCLAKIAENKLSNLNSLSDVSKPHWRSLERGNAKKLAGELEGLKAAALATASDLHQS
mmetsp:Transcript_9957/g.13872  ORF Transcript_9957/g.13872 Transcript_9957/m.13872 type:complete len:128 (+) Transcript_9957:1845-2228(+)